MRIDDRHFGNAKVDIELLGLGIDIYIRLLSCCLLFNLSRRFDSVQVSFKMAGSIEEPANYCSLCLKQPLQSKIVCFPRAR